MCLVGEDLVVVGGSRAAQKPCSDAWALCPVVPDMKAWQEDDYVLAVWLLGAIVSILLFIIPGVPDGYWMIPAPFVPLVVWKGLPRLMQGKQQEIGDSTEGSAGGTKETKKS